MGTSPAMQEVHRLIERVGSTEASVLLTGESGSGKELAAQSIHECSPRRSGPFISVNCGAIPAVSSRLNCSVTRKGSSPERCVRTPECSNVPRGGTLLLDEVTELPLDMQTRLLRVLETQKFYRVGATTGTSFDVRLIASTSHNPLQAVQDGRFREDLLYRLAVFPIAMPSLRERGGDVELLAEHFLSQLNARTERKSGFRPLRG